MTEFVRDRHGRANAKIDRTLFDDEEPGRGRGPAVDPRPETPQRGRSFTVAAGFRQANDPHAGILREPNRPGAKPREGRFDRSRRARIERGNKIGRRFHSAIVGSGRERRFAAV